jgi:hypothetical protein
MREVIKRQTQVSKREALDNLTRPRSSTATTAFGLSPPSSVGGLSCSRLLRGGSNRCASGLTTQVSSLLIEKVPTIGARPHDWDFSAVFPIVRGDDGAARLAQRSTRLGRDVRCET